MRVFSDKAKFLKFGIKDCSDLTKEDLIEYFKEYRDNLKDGIKRNKALEKAPYNGPEPTTKKGEAQMKRYVKRPNRLKERRDRLHDKLDEVEEILANELGA